MGQVSKQLGKRLNRWSGRFRQQIGQTSFQASTPDGVHDIKKLLKDGYDPLHAVYVWVQNITSVFAECVSVLPELKPYCDIVAAAEEEYLPSGPPMSPLTTSYFTSWAFFDLRFGSGLETLGTCLLDVSGELGMDSGMAGVVRQFQQSRMGIYEHCGNVGRRIRLRELVTDVEFSCHSGSGYVGKPGELWYVRLCPPLVDIADYHVAVTTPYILTGANKTDWMAYLNRAMLNLNTLEEGERLYALLKYGLSVHHWNEYIFLAFHHALHDAIFLAGIPDVQGSLPHAEKSKL